MKKGFTLIELLAVIVILAIIAIIATPIVLNIIEDTKKNATLRSADFYLEGVELSIAQATLKDKNIKNGTYNILENGNICLEYTDNQCSDELVVEVNGEVPNVGKITIMNGKIDDISLTYNSNTIIKDDKDQLVYENYFCSLNDLDENGLISIGDKITCDTESFYVISNDEFEIKMLTEKNIGKTSTGDVMQEDSSDAPQFSSNNYYFSSIEKYPMFEKYRYIYDSNSILYEYLENYKNFLGSNGLNINNIKLISYEELEKLGCEGNSCSKAKSWVYSKSYWTGSSSATAVTSGIFGVYSSGTIGSCEWDDDPDDFEISDNDCSFNWDGFGVRPVVTISTLKVK